MGDRGVRRTKQRSSRRGAGGAAAIREDAAAPLHVRGRMPRVRHPPNGNDSAPQGRPLRGEGLERAKCSPVAQFLAGDETLLGTAMSRRAGAAIHSSTDPPNAQPSVPSSGDRLGGFPVPPRKPRPGSVQLHSARTGWRRFRRSRRSDGTRLPHTGRDLSTGVVARSDGGARAVPTSAAWRSETVWPALSRTTMSLGSVWPVRRTPPHVAAAHDRERLRAGSHVQRAIRGAVVGERDRQLRVLAAAYVSWSVTACTAMSRATQGSPSASLRPTPPVNGAAGAADSVGVVTPVGIGSGVGVDVERRRGRRRLLDGSPRARVLGDEQPTRAPRRRRGDEEDEPTPAVEPPARAAGAGIRSRSCLQATSAPPPATAPRAG